MYEMIIYWYDEEQSYLVEVPELPGCMADGKSRIDAIMNKVVSAHKLEGARYEFVSINI